MPTIEQVLKSVVSRLSDQLGAEMESVVFMSDNPDEAPAVPAGIWYVVTPGTISFDEGKWDGGGNNQLWAEMIVVVTIHNTSQNDTVGRSTYWFSDSQRGIYPHMTRVIRALSTHMLQANGADILNQPMNVDQATGKPKSREDGSLQVGFKVVFDLDVS